MEDNKYLGAFEIIMNAGNSRAQSMKAVEAARQFDFEAAEEYLVQAEVEMRKAHQGQTDIITQEAKGEPVDVNIILVHSQDHLTMAMMAQENAAEMIHLYRMISELKNNQTK